MKKFEELFVELKEKIAVQDANSGTVKEFNKGKHFIGKKIVEEAAEVWMACEHQSKAEAAEEISQLLYHLQVMMIANDLELEDVYEYL
jgi:phosphoribosyl-ATP pyrophosphohydrolase